MDVLLVLSGALTGLLVGLTGVGGGALMTPLLLLLFGTAPATAIGTDLWFAAITKLCATRQYHRDGLIDWIVVKRLWAGSIPASALALLWLHGQTPDAAFVQFLRTAIAGAILLTASGLLLQKQIHAIGKRYRLNKAERFKALQKPLTVAAGALLGVLVTVTSIGSGALGAVMLVYLYPLRLTPPRLVATDVLHAIPLTMFAGLGHLWIGNVDFPLLGQLLLGSIPGILIGARLSARLPHALLKGLLGLVLLGIGIKLLY